MKTINNGSASVKNTLTAEESERLAQCESIVEKSMTSFIEVGEALKEIRDKRLYRETCGTFQEYLELKWNFTRQRAHQLIDSAEIAQGLSTTVDISERATRELNDVVKERRDDVVKAAAEKGPVTAKAIKETAAEMGATKPKPKAPEPESVFTCDTCEAKVNESDTDIDSPLFECGECGTYFTRENSADGDSNRCPDCNKFGRKAGERGCPECGEGELLTDEEMAKRDAELEALKAPKAKAPEPEQPVTLYANIINPEPEPTDAEKLNSTVQKWYRAQTPQGRGKFLKFAFGRSEKVEVPNRVAYRKLMLDHFEGCVIEPEKKPKAKAKAKAETKKTNERKN